MNKLLTLVVTIITASWLMNPAQVFAQIWLDTNYYKGPINTYHVINGSVYTDDDGTIHFAEIYFQTKFVVDQQGNELQTTYYTWEGANCNVIESISEPVYENGIMTKRIETDSNHLITGWFIYTYNASGTIASVIKFHSDSTVAYELRTQYNESNFPIYEIKKEAGIVTDSIAYSYNLTGQCISKGSYSNGSQKPFHSVEYTYANDALTSTTIKSDGDIQRLIFSYPSSGFCISTHIGRSKHSSSIQYFDKDSNEVKVVTFSKKGKINSVIERQFSSTGKVVVEEIVDRDGQQTVTYSYDSYDNLIERKRITDFGVSIESWKNVYDDYGNCIKCIEYSPSGEARHMYIQMITYFNI